MDCRAIILLPQKQMNEIKISTILERPIGQQHWPHLQQIMKGLNEYINQRAKNRQYLQAQRGKEKIIECQDQIKKRSRNDINQREQHAIDELSLEHSAQKERFEKEWTVRTRKIEKEYYQIINKKQQKYQLETEKYEQQLEIALPLNNSPDKQMYHLRHQQEMAAQTGDFVQAQRIKMEIMKKELQLSKKYQKLRESNIKTLMQQLQNKQRNDILTLEARRDQKLDEIERQKNKRLKELNDKHQRQIKELIWIYNQQKKKLK